MSTPKDQQPQIINENECYYTSIYSVGLEDSAWQQSNWGEYKQLSLWKSTPTLNSSSDITSQESPSIPISETTTQSQENLTSLQWDFPVQVHQMQEAEQDSNIQLHHSGEKDLDALSKLNPSSVLWNSLKELSDEDFELFLGDLVWQDTLLKLKQSRQQAKALDNRGTDCLSFPTLTSNSNSTSRPAGQVKCEKWFKDKGLIQPGYQLGTKAIGSASARSAIALMMGFPSNWFEVLSQKNSKNLNIQSHLIPQAESEQDISQVEQLPQDKQPLPSAESCISIPCLVKQPKQPEIKGVIREDRGDCFTVYIPSEGFTVTVPKLFVYPDFSKLDKCSSKNIPSSKNCSSKTTPPSKTRRRKGEGSGAIFYRTITKNGKEYQQAYYHWREGGKQRSKYIPKKLLNRVQEAESDKLTVANILEILQGGLQKCSSKKFDSFSDKKLLTNNQSAKTLAKCSSKITSPPCTKNLKRPKRQQGYGAGYIECRKVKRGSKLYSQFWYHYEFWSSGDRVTKKSRYIPKRLLARVEKMEAEKVSVRKILFVLISKGKVRQK